MKNKLETKHNFELPQDIGTYVRIQMLNVRLCNYEQKEPKDHCIAGILNYSFTCT